MTHKNILAAIAVAIAILVPISGASVVTLTGGCPLNIVNSTNNYITFNLTNTGNGTASDFLVGANFTGISSANQTQVIPQLEPGASYSKRFYLSPQAVKALYGSYAINLNATYVQAGSNYATVFPCIIYIGSQVGGPLLESVSVSGDRLYVNVTNTGPQKIEAQVSAVIPPVFSVQAKTKAVTVAPDGKAGTVFNITTPNYNDASFPVIGELSYEYNGTHYAQMGSAAIVFGSGGSTSGGGLSITMWALLGIIIVILILIVVSLLKRHMDK